MRKIVVVGMVLGGVVCGSLGTAYLLNDPKTAKARRDGADQNAEKRNRVEEQRLHDAERRTVARRAGENAPAPNPLQPITPAPEDGVDEGATAEDGRRKQIQNLRASGPDQRDLVDSARQVGAAWMQAMQLSKLDVAFGEWECFRAGCLVDARHGSTALVDQVSSEITRSPAFHQWNGEKMRTGPVATEGGKTLVTWVLFPPPEGEPAMHADENFKVWGESDRHVRADVSNDSADPAQ